MEGSLKGFYVESVGAEMAKAGVGDFLDAFDAFMEGAAFMLDVVGQIEYTYTTKSGNKVHVLMDSPEEE